MPNDSFSKKRQKKKKTNSLLKSMPHWFKQSNCVQEDLDIETLTWAKRKCEAGEDERETETEWSSERVREKLKIMKTRMNQNSNLQTKIDCDEKNWRDSRD